MHDPSFSKWKKKRKEVIYIHNIWSVLQYQCEKNQASAVSLYIIYLTWSALTNSGEVACMPPPVITAKGNKFDLQSIISLIIFAGCVLYSSIRNSSNTQVIFELQHLNKLWSFEIKLLFYARIGYLTQNLYLTMFVRTTHYHKGREADRNQRQRWGWERNSLRWSQWRC